MAFCCAVNGLCHPIKFNSLDSTKRLSIPSAAFFKTMFLKWNKKTIAMKQLEKVNYAHLSVLSIIQYHYFLFKHSEFVFVFMGKIWEIAPNKIKQIERKWITSTIIGLLWCLTLICGANLNECLSVCGWCQLNDEYWFLMSLIQPETACNWAWPIQLQVA